MQYKVRKKKQKNRLKFNKELTFNFVKLLVLGSNNKIIQSTIIDLNNEKLLKKCFQVITILKIELTKFYIENEKKSAIIYSG